MADSLEERLTEMEAISQIFEGEVRRLQDAAVHDQRQHGGSWVVFEISVAEHYPLHDPRNFAAVRMTVRLGPKYPDKEPPKISMTRCPGFETPSDARVQDLRRFAVNEAATHIGQPAVYEVVTALREKLAESNTPTLALHDEMLRRKSEEEETAKKQLADEHDRRLRHAAEQQEARELEARVTVERNKRKQRLQETLMFQPESSDDQDIDSSWDDQSSESTSTALSDSSTSSPSNAGASRFWDINPVSTDVDASSRSRMSTSLNEVDMLPGGLPVFSTPDTTEKSSTFMRQLLRRYFESIGVPSQARLIPASVLDSQDRKLFANEQKDLSKFRRLFKSEIANAAKSRDPDCEKFWKAMVSLELKATNRNPKSRFTEDFKYVRSLGQGGFGSVVKAKNRLDGRSYAVKRVPLYGSDVTSRHILREVVTLSRMMHPNIVRYHQAWLEDAANSSFGQREVDQEWTSTGNRSAESTDAQVNKYLYIQMEYCKQTLRHFIDKVDDANVDLWALFRQIVEGLNDIHSRKIVHRDLKPTNIFMGNLNGDVKIGDFGLAMDIRTASVPNTNQSSFGEQISGSSFAHYLQASEDAPAHDSPSLIEVDQTRGVGTLLYRAPELDDANFSQGYTSKVDIFSLGVIAWELFHGPYSTAHERAMELVKLRERGPSKSFEASMPRQATLIRALLQLDPDSRPSADEILNGDFLPPKHEDEYMRDMLRQVSQIDSSVRQRVVDQLFIEEPANALTQNRQTIDVDDANFTQQTMSNLRRELSSAGLVEVQTQLFLSETFGRGTESILSRSGKRMYPRHHILHSFIPVACDIDSDLRRFEIGPVWNIDHDESGVVPDSLVGRNIVVDNEPISPWTDCLQIDTVLRSPWSPSHAEIIQITRRVVRHFGPPSNHVLRIGHTKLSSMILNRCGVADMKIEGLLYFLESQRGHDWPSTRKLLLESQLDGHTIERLAQFELTKGSPTTTLPKLCQLLHLTGKKSRPVHEVDKYLQSRQQMDKTRDKHVSFGRRASMGSEMKNYGRSTVAMNAARFLDETATLLHHLDVLECGEDAWEVVLDPLFGKAPTTPYEGLMFEIACKDPSMSSTPEIVATGGNWTAQLDRHAKRQRADNEAFGTGSTVLLEKMLHSPLMATKKATETLRFSGSKCDVFVAGGSIDRRIRIRGLLLEEGMRCGYLERLSPSFKEQKLAAISRGAQCLVELDKPPTGHLVITRLNGRESTISTTDTELVSRLRQFVSKGTEEERWKAR